MAFVVKMDTDNAAFEGRNIDEICDILDKVKLNLRHGLFSAPIQDSNGNTVGFYQFPSDTRLIKKIDEYWEENTGIR